MPIAAFLKSHYRSWFYKGLMWCFSWSYKHCYRSLKKNNKKNNQKNKIKKGPIVAFDKCHYRQIFFFFLIRARGEKRPIVVFDKCHYRSSKINLKKTLKKNSKLKKKINKGPITVFANATVGLQTPL